MLEHDISDKRIINLIKKWLKAGVINRDKSIEKPKDGTPQGGVISPVLANVYLHYALDIWFEKVVKKHVAGECKLIRYADDFVCTFRYKRDAENFMSGLEKRLKKFNLDLAKDKTKLIRFSRFTKDTNESFDFLGFTFRWEVSRKGKDIITHKTSKKKFNQSVQNLKTWIKENRNYRLRKLFEILNTKLRGYYNYYGITGNSDMLNEFNKITIRLLYKWLNRRSQRRSFNWEEFTRKIKWYGIIKPFIQKKYGQMVFNI